jgi:xylulokinase
VTRAAGEDASALGAAIVAGVAVGVWKSAEEAAAQIPQTSVLEPIPANARRYRELFQVYRSLYSDLKRSFDALSAFAGASPG